MDQNKDSTKNGKLGDRNYSILKNLQCIICETKINAGIFFFGGGGGEIFLGE